MAGLEECKDELTELAETIGLSPERVDARAGEIARHYWGELDGAERQQLAHWLEAKSAEARAAVSIDALRGRARMANVTDAALAEITKLIQAERKA